ncbi:hypothetical protein ASE17_17710 [Phenylobacterium sp. Root77]|uniref:FecR domain-containing protein n=1 Tax=unclassified Phenylobacterium TaxID=2640670 RepID=UPI0006F2B040|nr:MULTISPECIES: FecR domain-containing protein [unclassified Phenylobacterium]KQW70707.1 hypothetical protein ASC73_11580 [Phenylobacterium sp. Root1277]KQW90872.1 hypothetical protein ASC79_16010 [Phenylobacterium sp. Root1290]KRC39496.1 hypothetical protein ASE17_17710 [Phenylobacterium sp. Root77]
MSWKRAAIAGLALQALAAAPAMSAEPVERYVVQPGDTLYELGRRYFAGGDYRTVQRLNRVADPKRLQAGSQLKVPARLLKITPIEARVAGFRGAVTVTAGGRTLPVSTGMMLNEGAVVATGPNAFLRLDLPDGTHLSLPSQSRVRLGKMTMVEMTGVVRRDLEVQSGRLESAVTPLRNPRDSYTVRTPMSVSAVRGTEFRVAYDTQAERASTEVIEGLVAVSADRQGEDVAAAYGAVTTAAGVSAPISLAAAPNVANLGRVQDEQAVRFQISGPAAARGYHVRLAADAGFVEVLDETASDTPDLALGELPDGVYFLRLAAMDDNGLLGLPATYAFERRLNTLTTSAPVASRDGGLRRYKFRWQVGGAGERTYRLQLLRDGAEAPVVDEAGLTMQELTITDLPPGVYNWRVMSRTFAGGGYYEKWTPLERFEIGR